MIHQLATFVMGVACLSGFVFGLRGVWCDFRAMANRRPDVSLWRVWRNELLFGRYVYLEDLFTDVGQTWARASLRNFGRLALAIIAALAAGLISEWTKPF